MLHIGPGRSVRRAVAGALFIGAVAPTLLVDVARAEDSEVVIRATALEPRNDEDPGSYRHPPGTVALRATDADLARDGIDVNGRGKGH